MHAAQACTVSLTVLSTVQLAGPAEHCSLRELTQAGPGRLQRSHNRRAAAVECPDRAAPLGPGALP